MRTSYKTIALAAALLIFAGTGPARANGVSLNTENGDVQTGSITTTGTDDYYYDSTAGYWLKFGASDTSSSYRFSVVQVSGATAISDGQGRDSTAGQAKTLASLLSVNSAQ